jgi:hypothetical protein
MQWTHGISYFFGGVFLANTIPHLVSGLMGRAFQTPFAKPPGEGLSSSTVNVVWGFVNLVFGYLLICQVENFDLRSVPEVCAAGSGVFLVSLFSASHFGKFHGGKKPSASDSDSK